MGVRFLLLTIAFGILFGLLGLNIYSLQIQKGGYYVNKVQARDEALAQLQLRRGQIFFNDKYGNNITVALNKDYPVIYGVPKEAADPQKTAETLSPILNKPVQELKDDLDDPTSLFHMVDEKVSQEELDAVQALNLPGIYESTKQYRFYPFENLGAQLLGFVGLNKDTSAPKGLYGTEKNYDAPLADGHDIALTIDRNLQAQAEQMIEKLVNDHQAESGNVIIEEPKTGKILAIADYPNFDPNNYKNYPIKDFINSAVQLVYEPGSVFKPITMAAGIDAGIITPTSTYTDYGHVTINGKTITNWDHKAYGPNTTITQVIERSINTGAVFAEQKIGRPTFLSYLKLFGLGVKTGIDLPDEVTGSLANLERKGAQDIDYATAAYGQGTSVTPLQMINAFSVFANGGLLMRPYINADSEPFVVRRVISEDTAKKVIEMMRSAVEKGGVATIPQFNVAGKTGTAFIPDFVHGGYLPDDYIHTFIGMAPSTNPQFVIMIKLEKPEVGKELAALTVVPAFQQLAAFALNYLNITPDNIQTPSSK
ncbi:MAG: penicillin-binding protein 2 [Minisyncoccia bacterium]|jgi:cell division protein FtsI/penicillin-binding protein 2